MEGALPLKCVADVGRGDLQERLPEVRLADAPEQLGRHLGLGGHRLPDPVGRLGYVGALGDGPADDQDQRTGPGRLRDCFGVQAPGHETGMGDARARASRAAKGVLPAICMSMPMCQQTAPAPSSAERLARATGSGTFNRSTTISAPYFSPPDGIGDRIVVGGAEDGDEVRAGLCRDLDLEGAGVHHFEIRDDPVIRERSLQLPDRVEALAFDEWSTRPRPSRRPRRPLPSRPGAPATGSRNRERPGEPVGRASRAFEGLRAINGEPASRTTLTSPGSVRIIAGDARRMADVRSGSVAQWSPHRRIR